MSIEVSRMPGANSAVAGEQARLRADARRNRDRIVEVARELFAERGLEAPMATIARKARVGVATLYRRFPTKDLLITEVFSGEFATCVAVVDDGLADADPWRGFCHVLERVCAMQAADRGFGAAFLASFPGRIDIGPERERALRGFATLADRAKAAGRLRADFDTADLPLLLMANNGVTSDSVEVTRAASRRLLAYLLDSLRAEHVDPSRPLPPPAPLSIGDIGHWAGRG